MFVRLLVCLSVFASAPFAIASVDRRTTRQTDKQKSVELTRILWFDVYLMFFLAILAFWIFVFSFPTSPLRWHHRVISGIELLDVRSTRHGSSWRSGDNGRRATWRWQTPDTIFDYETFVWLEGWRARTNLAKFSVSHLMLTITSSTVNENEKRSGLVCRLKHLPKRRCSMLSMAIVIDLIKSNPGRCNREALLFQLQISVIRAQE